jgi:hypothetical protein
MIQKSGGRILAGMALPCCLILSALANTGPLELSSGRQLLKLQSGEAAEISGLSYASSTPAIAVVSTSSELVTIAVIAGQLAQGSTVAKAGQALVTPIEGSTTQRFGFDAARLAATLPAEWQSDVSAPLDRLAADQQRAKFWGLTEPAGINASAPMGPQVEAVRQSYLGNDTIMSLRRAAQGRPEVLAELTARRFAEALAAGNAAAVAALLDPKPFTDTGAAATAWQATRLAFAQHLTGDETLKQAMTTAPVAVAGASDVFLADGAFRIQLVTRDRAMFVTAVEPQSGSAP